ncbi:MAG: hypothetical protein GY799_25780 [Desulfobulbaceae bacterium]|nr:hypothetical protein [Desulfobulbaceae bacterium]
MYSGPRCSRHDPTAPLPPESGNAIELSTGKDRILAISARAAASLTKEQKADIEESARIVELSVPTIELAGGSIRCMLAGIHLVRRY